MVRGFKTKAERMAVEIRRELNLGVKDRLPAERLAGHLKLTLLSPHSIPELDQTSIERLASNDCGFSAIHLFMCDRHFVIGNPSHAPTRKESDLMHEMAHIICKHRSTGVRLVNDSLPVLEYDEEQEEQAKFLGGCLQIPKDGLVKHLFSGKTKDEIADHYGASVPMVNYRLFASGAGSIHRRSLSKLPAYRA